MPKEQFTVRNLERVLLKLGFHDASVRGSHRAYRHPSSGAVVVLPWQHKSEILRPVHLVSVRKTLSEMGILDSDFSDGLLEREAQATSSQM
jgi:predicted RNA binding protein YcfA (HicA-like mRNA interferase family)